MRGKLERLPDRIAHLLNGEDKVTRDLESELQGKFSSANYLINRSVVVSAWFVAVFLSFLILSLFANAASNSVIALGFVVLSFNFVLAVHAIGIWRLGKYLGGVTHRFWKKHTDPSQFDFERPLHKLLVPTLPVVRLQEYDAPATMRLEMAVKQCFAAAITFSVLGALLVAFDIPQQLPESEVGVGGSVSLLAGFLSALLNPLFGVITLGVVSISNHVEDIALLFAFIIGPSVFLVPAAMNFLLIAEQFARDISFGIGHFFPANRPLPLLGSFIYLLTMGIIWSYLMWTLWDNLSTFSLF